MLQPRSFSLRMMFSLMPQSTATTSKRGLNVREYQRFLQLTRATWSRGSLAFLSFAIASSWLR